MKAKKSRCRGHRFPPAVTGSAEYLYFRYTLSLRDIEELLAERGIAVSYETIRRWCLKFGPQYRQALKRKEGRLGDVWLVDEVYLTINGHRHYLWRATQGKRTLLSEVAEDEFGAELVVPPARFEFASHRVFFGV